MTGLVWYRRSAFAAAGYQVPTTLGELTTLTHRMIADGHTPWCLGAYFADAGGWTITDWLEALVLRTAGPDLYARWMAHDAAFDDPAVQRAGALLDDIFTPGSVRGGPAGVKDLDWLGAGLPLASDPPGCWMFEGVDYAPNVYPLPFQRSGDLDYFVLPPADGSTAPADDPRWRGRGRDERPSRGALMRYFAGRDWGFEGAKQPLDYLISPRVNLAVGSCADPEGTRPSTPCGSASARTPGPRSPAVTGSSTRRPPWQRPSTAATPITRAAQSCPACSTTSAKARSASTRSSTTSTPPCRCPERPPL